MITENMIFLFVIIVPILAVALSFFSFQLYKQSNQKKIMIDILTDSSNHILDTHKKVVLNNSASAIKNKLNFAGFSHISAEYTFILISIGFGILVGLGIFIVIKILIISIISAVIFSTFPYIVLLKIITSRQEEFNFGLKSIIDKVTSMMKSGVGFEQAFKKSILTSKSEFTKEVFNIYIKEKDIIGEDKSFEKMFKLVESKELRIFYLVISIGRQSGGKFSNTLETLRKTLHAQGTIKQEITSSTKEIKIGTYMIIALTIGIYMMMDSVFKGKLNEHFFNSTDGQIQMFFIVIWVAFGLFVNSLMTKIKA